MIRRKMVQSNLFRNSTSAYMAAIELHNKPNFNYRYETVSLLIINAWELILKSFIRKFIKNKSIYKDAEHTISLDKAILYVDEYINANIKQHEFTATKENIKLIESYRNDVAHCYNEAIEPIIFSIIAKNSLDYVEFVKRYFNKDIVAQDGLFILPLGFKLPFNPEYFLSNKYSNYQNPYEVIKFIDKVVNVVSSLKEDGIEDSIVLGFNIYLDSVKKIENSDLLVAITNIQEADVNFAQIKKIQITNDTSATKVVISDEELFEQYPLVYVDIRVKCKTRYTNCIINSEFTKIMEKIREIPELSIGRKLKLKKQDKPDTYIYSERVFDYLDAYYKKSV
jgi:hypothetical protein